MNKKRITMLFGLLFLCMITVKAYAEEWIYLGESHVDGDHDHDKIHVGKHDGHFRAIQLRVRGGAIEFDRVVVHFGNGTSEELSIRAVIPDGERTRAIELPGEHRVIDNVELWYSKAHWEHKPQVTLFGLR
ncbi:MAG TPA: hypothetical protein VNX66_15745 [Candidatus Sulfotelmatobacter sp.]|jgi:hypothetical protein|nr:hypothetical protein [Candidatus Sulfotelmatobacter sp.]